jgi:hypothetical protein
METFQPGQLMQLKDHPERVVYFAEIDADGMAVCWWDTVAGERQQGRFRIPELQPYLRRPSNFRPEVTNRQCERRY